MQLSLEDKNTYIKKIQDFYYNEREEELGIIAAGELLDFFLGDLGKVIYNKAVDDCKKRFSEGVDNTMYDMDELYQ